MPKFSKQSLAKLETCDKKIQDVLHLAIKRMDFVVLSGHRSKAEQMELYKKGRIKENGQWKKIGATVTNIDGLSKMSKHNYSPSKAVDIAPFPIDWNDLNRFKALSKVILECAEELGIDLEWGGNWKKFPDMPHYEIK